LIDALTGPPRHQKIQWSWHHVTQGIDDPFHVHVGQVRKEIDLGDEYEIGL
jgi:hypothetical protein